MMLLFNLLVVFMFEGFAEARDWTQFNSSLLVEVTRSNGVFTSTGVAVSNNTIITAAHSLEGDVKKVRIFLSEHYDPKEPSLEISKYEIHPNYDPKKSRYLSDVAKIILKEKLPSNIKLYPIYEDKIVKGNIYRFGYGARNKKNNRTAITPTFRRMNFIDKVVELNDHYSRSGDSGGPVYVEDGNKIFILAIHSTFSSGPEGEYSFNPLLAPYLSWIYQN